MGRNISPASLSHIPKKSLGAVCCILSATLFGTMPLLAKIAYEHGSNAYTVAFGRYLFGSIMLFAILSIKPGGSVRVTRRQLLQAFGLSIFFALTSILLYASYDLIDSGLATTLHFTYPIAVIVLTAVFFHARVGAKEIICTALCGCGMLLLYTPGQVSSMVGMLIAAASGLAYSLYIVFLGKSDVRNVPVLTLSFWVSVFCAVEVGIVAGLGGQLRFDLNWQGWSAEIVLAVVATVLASTLFQRGVLLSGEVQASLFSTFEPLTGVVLGLLLFNELLTGKSAAGIFCILLATVVLVLPQKRKHNLEEMKHGSP